jgi:transcription-repair coupling factor (superfamily II helicase)
VSVTRSVPFAPLVEAAAVAKSAAHVEVDAPFEAPPTHHLVASAIEGRDAQFLADLAAAQATGQLLHVARDGPRATHLAELIRVFAPDLDVVLLPAWDCLPYDRVSPNQDIMAERLDALAHLLDGASAPRLIVTTGNARVQ